MNELESLKEEMDALKRSLDKQEIVNERLLRSVMRQKASWLNSFVKLEFILIPVTFVIFAVACAAFGVSQWYALSFLILALIDAAFDLRTFRIPARLLNTGSMMDVRRILVRQKKERFIQTCVGLPLAIAWVMLFSMAVLNGGKSPMSGAPGVVGGIIGGIIGGIVVIIIYRKAQKTNDGLIEDSYE